MTKNNEKKVKSIQLLGKIFLKGLIMTQSGLHIGGATTGIDIGGVDSIVIRDPLTNRPYIPGSSLKGKMRSLLEKFYNLKQYPITEDISIHQCRSSEEYENCDLCKIFGVVPVKNTDSKEKKESLEKESWKPTRITVRDAILTEKSIEDLENADTDLTFTEVKWEAVIDRVTSKAMPRQIERVPAGVTFEFQLNFNIFEEEDKKIFEQVLLALELLEHDYLGGQGTRGYGQIQFQNLNVFWNSNKDYENGLCDLKTKKPIYQIENVTTAVKNFNQILSKLNESE